MTVSFQREGARIGGCTQSTVSMTVRVDASAVTGTPVISIECSKQADFGVLAGTVTVGSPTSGNAYQDTCYVSGLQANTKYYWRAKISDDDGTVLGDAQSDPTLYSGNFRTLPANTVTPWRVLISGCIQGRQPASGGHQASRASHDAQNMIAMNPDWQFWLGDNYYCDVGSSNLDVNGAANWTNDATDGLQPGAWYAQDGNNATDVNDFTLDKSRTNWITSTDASIYKGKPFGYAHLFAHAPVYWMWDDHDHGWNDASDQPGKVDGTPASTFWGTRRDRAHQVGHECFMDMNKPLIDADEYTTRDFDTEAKADSVDPEEFFYVDIPPARFVVLDTRSLRDDHTDTDTSSKSILNGSSVSGNTVNQLTWLKWHIDNNPQPYLFICSTVGWDGNHGNPGETGDYDGFKGYSYERQEILDYIRLNGNPHRTILISSDFHAGQVNTYTGKNNASPAIWEFMSGNHWHNPAEDWNSGYGSGAANNDAGGKIQYMQTKTTNCLLIDGGPGYVRVGLWETQRQTDDSVYTKPRLVYQREFI